jgi:pimeloyl-ACP methyl ester carboxylesterase
MEEFFLPDSGIYCRCNDIGLDRPTLLFVHGLTGSSSAWWPYEKIFDEKYNLATFDLLGHGKSVKSSDFSAYNISKLANDIYKLAQYLHLKKFILISHSFGTLVALEFLLSHEDMVSKAIFFSPNVGVSKTRTAQLSRAPVSLLVKILRLWNFSKASGKHINYADYPNVGDWDIALNFVDIKNTSLHIYLFCLKYIYDSNYDKAWQKLTIQSLIVHGKSDSLIPANEVESFQKDVKNSQLILLENANHLFVLNNPRETAKIISDFVDNKIAMV